MKASRVELLLIALAILAASPQSFAADAAPAATPALQANPAANPAAAPTAAPAAPAKKETSDITDIVDKLEYPELQVVPRASQRLKIEAADEDHNWYYAHWPVEVAGLMTLMTGLQASTLRDGLLAQEKTDSAFVSNITKTIGAGWLIGGVLVGLQQPYRSGMKMIAHTKDSEKGDRAALLRERLAEEALERPAKMMKVITVASSITNCAASLLMGYYLTDQGRMVAGASAILAWLPFMFEDHSIEVYEKHLEYKKKIYGPLTGVAVGFDPKTRQAVPMTQLTWNF